MNLAKKASQNQPAISPDDQSESLSEEEEVSSSEEHEAAVVQIKEESYKAELHKEAEVTRQKLRSDMEAELSKFASDLEREKRERMGEMRKQLELELSQDHRSPPPIEKSKDIATKDSSTQTVSPTETAPHEATNASVNTTIHSATSHLETASHPIQGKRANCLPQPTEKTRDIATKDSSVQTQLPAKTDSHSEKCSGVNPTIKKQISDLETEIRNLRCHLTNNALSSEAASDYSSSAADDSLGEETNDGLKNCWGKNSNPYGKRGNNPSLCKSRC